MKWEMDLVASQFTVKNARTSVPKMAMITIAIKRMVEEKNAHCAMATQSRIDHATANADEWELNITGVKLITIGAGTIVALILIANHPSPPTIRRVNVN